MSKRKKTGYTVADEFDRLVGRLSRIDNDNLHTALLLSMFLTLGEYVGDIDFAPLLKQENSELRHKAWSAIRDIAQVARTVKDTQSF